MDKPGDDHRAQWVPPPRPEWVHRLNEEGECMDIEDVVPLDEDSLLDTAKRNTGLSDFGADDWREPFHVFIKSLREESLLNLTGRIRTRSEVLMLLEARLRIEDWYKRHPEIEDEQIIQPIVIIGQGRSGTSFLQNMLAADSENGTLMHWEAVFPCPPPEKATYRSDPRIPLANKRLGQWNRVTPTLASMHEVAGDMPTEDCAILAINFMSPNYLGVCGQIPGFDKYILAQNPTPALRYERRVLKLLQWRNPRRRWVIKEPMHLYRLAALRKVFPDACLVWPHRDPVRALASLVSIIGTVQWGRSDFPFKYGSQEYMTDPRISAAGFDSVIDQLEAGVFPPGQVCHMLYRDLMADTLGTIEAMYRRFGIPLSAASRAAMAQYLADNPRDARPSHRFNAGSPEAVARAREAFKRYQATYQVPDE